jgi:hypothetical protein
MSGSSALNPARSMPLSATPTGATENTEIHASPTALSSLEVTDEKAPVEFATSNQPYSSGQTERNSDNEYEDPLSLGVYKRPHVSAKRLKIEHPKANKRQLKKFYTRQNQLIDQFLQSGDEERLQALDYEANGPKIKFAIYMSSGVNFCLFIIQMYAAITTGSLSLFATAADAFVSYVRLARCENLLTS